MKKMILLISGLMLYLNCIEAQTLNQFNDLLTKNDTIGQLALLEKWEASNVNDPDLYVAYFNYYYKKSMKEVIRMDKYPKGKDVFQILDTLTKEPVGYMYSDIFFQPEIIGKGLEYINKGIEKFPTRLDMRFGKVYIFGEMRDFDSFTREIIDAVDYSKVIDNKWMWKENKPLEDPKNYMLGTIQSYQLQLYNTGDDSLLIYMAKIARVVLKYYPDHIESLSNLSVVYLLQKEYDDALEILLRAEKINSQDYIVLSNIAQAYKLMGDNKNAIKYYKLTSKYGDDKAKQYAKTQIQELERK